MTPKDKQNAGKGPLRAKKGHSGKQVRPRGRPSKYNEEIADRICDRISEGEALYKVARDSGMPDQKTMFRWLEQFPSFRHKYARAKEQMLEREADNILAIADSDDDPNSRRVRVDTRKWLLSKLIPKKYGDKIVIYGSLDVVDGLLKYDGDELDEYITERFGIYAPGGGFIFNGGHFIQPDIPPARLIRAYRLVNKLAQQYGTLQ